MATYLTVPNGTFETAPAYTADTNVDARWIDGSADGSTTTDTYKWKTRITAGGAAGFSFDTAQKRTGSYSLKLAVSTGAAGVNGIHANLGAGSSPSTTIQSSYFIPIDASTSYILTAWIKTDSVSNANSNGARILAYQYDGAGTASVGNKISAYYTGTNDWTAVILPFTSAATAAYLNLWLQINNETGTLWVDDITLEKTNIKSINGMSKYYLKSENGLAVANIKSINGLS